MENKKEKITVYKEDMIELQKEVSNLQWKNKNLENELILDLKKKVKELEEENFDLRVIKNKKYKNIIKKKNSQINFLLDILKPKHIKSLNDFKMIETYDSFYMTEREREIKNELIVEQQLLISKLMKENEELKNENN